MSARNRAAVLEPKSRMSEWQEVNQTLRVPVELTDSDAAMSILCWGSAGASLMTTELMLSFSIQTHLRHTGARRESSGQGARAPSLPGAYPKTRSEALTGSRIHKPFVNSNFSVLYS